MADIASLVVSLSAETSQYSAAIKKSTEEISKFSETVGDSIRDVAKDLLALEALKQVFDFTENIVKTMASFELLSHAVGATTESLSQLSFAGKLEGIDDIGFALERMARSVGAVETGNKKLIGTFDALGVSTTDARGKIKSTEQQLLDIADAVSKYNDGLAKTSAVQAIFGRSGAEFVAFLDQGAAAIKAAQQEAIDLGVSISSPAAQAAHEFEQDMTRIGAAFQGIFFKALQEVLPVFKSITEAMVDFAKNANNTAPIVEQLAAGFKIIGTVLVIVGTAFHAAGQAIGAFAFGVVTEVKAVVEYLTTAWLHPIDAVKNYVIAQQQILSTYAQASVDIFKIVKDGASNATNIWGNANDQLNEISITAKKIKPDLVLIDQSAVKGLEKEIEVLATLNDKLKEQVATYGLSGAAATVYDVTLGRLSATVDALNKKGSGEALQALAALEKQGKLSKASVDEINAAIKAGVPIGEAFRKSIIDEATALEQLKGVDALSKLDSQLLTMTGHLEEAAKAAFDLANRPLRITIQTAQDTTQLAGLTLLQKHVEVIGQINALKQQASTIEDELGKKTADIDAADLAAGASSLKIAGDEAVARQNAISQLETLFVKAQALANATGMKSAIREADELRAAIGAIQFNPKIVEDVDKLTEAQKRFNEALKQEKGINEDLSLELTNLALQKSQGSLTDLDFMQKEDDARQKTIDQLIVMRQTYADLARDNPTNPAALDEWKKLGIQITQLQTQMGELARTVRTDLTDSLSKAFVDFEDGSKSAGAAIKSFVADFSKQMLELAAKQLFQKLFETTGISNGINSLFGAASKAVPAATSAASGLAGTSAAATSIGTAITTAATAGGTALGTGITTGATAGATEIGTGITTAGTAAATEMGTAITTAGSAAASEMAAAITAAGASSGASSGAVAAIAAAAGGGPIPANQLTLVGEKGPELYVSDLGAQTAATATKAGTVIPEDLTHAHVIGTQGPEYIRPNVGGFVVPSDVFLKALNDRIAPASLSPIPAGPDVKAEPAVAAQVQETARPETAAAITPDAIHSLAPVIDLAPLLAARLPAREEQLFKQPETTPAEMSGHETPVDAAPARATVESRGSPPLDRAPPSNVIAFPARPPPAVARGDLAPAKPELPPVPDQSDASTPESQSTNLIASPASPSATSDREFAPPVGSPSPPSLDRHAPELPSTNVIAFPLSLASSADAVPATHDLPPIPDQAGLEQSTTNVIAFPVARPLPAPASDHEFTATALDAASALPSVPDRLDTEVTRADAPEMPMAIDAPTSAMIVKFEKIVKHEQSQDMLDAHEYEAMLTDRYLQKRAGGGPVSAGKPYLVGEGGPELMVPDSSGTVMNSQMSKVGTTVYQTFVLPPGSSVSRPTQQQIGAQAAMGLARANRRGN